MHSLKVVSYVSFEKFAGNYSLGNSLSDSSEELLQRGREEPGYKGIFAENETKHVVEYQKITANHNPLPPEISSVWFWCFSTYGKMQASELIDMIT